MSAERIFRAIADVGDDLVARAENEAKPHSSAWLRWGALAASCALVIGIAAIALPRMGLGSKMKSAADTAAQYEMSKAAVTEEACEEPAEIEMPAEEPAPELQIGPAMAGTPADEPAAGDLKTEEQPCVAEDAAVLPLLERECAKIVLRCGSDASVTVTEEAEVDEIMQALRALPLVHEDTDVRAEVLQLYLYEAGTEEYYAFVELPVLRVADAGQSQTGEPAQDYCSAEANTLYEALLGQYFPE